MNKRLKWDFLEKFPIEKWVSTGKEREHPTNFVNNNKTLKVEHFFQSNLFLNGILKNNTDGGFFRITRPLEQFLSLKITHEFNDLDENKVSIVVFVTCQFPIEEFLTLSSQEEDLKV